jgi:hypothetical protein
MLVSQATAQLSGKDFTITTRVRDKDAGRA